MDNQYWKNVNGKIVTIPSIDDLCLSLREKFLDQEKSNKSLSDTIEMLKNSIWEKEEVALLKSENESIREESKYGFGITKEEHEKIEKWIENKEKINTGAIGGRYEYRFFPTGIGVVGRIVDTIKNDSFVFRDLD